MKREGLTKVLIDYLSNLVQPIFGPKLYWLKEKMDWQKDARSDWKWSIKLLYQSLNLGDPF